MASGSPGPHGYSPTGPHHVTTKNRARMLGEALHREEAVKKPRGTPPLQPPSPAPGEPGTPRTPGERGQAPGQELG